jgi:putative addiction module component (TIGR02574 family)
LTASEAVHIPTLDTDDASRVMFPSEAGMGLAQLKDQIEQLSADEQLRLVEEIWDRLSADPGVVPVPSDHLAELRRRIADHDALPDDVVSWGDLKDEFRS